MQLTKYQKTLLLGLLGDRKHEVNKQKDLYSRNKRLLTVEISKEEKAVNELIAIIENIPTLEEFVAHLEMLQDKMKDATFEERVKIYQEENAKANVHTMDLNSILSSARYMIGHTPSNAPCDIMNFDGMTDIKVPNLPLTMPSHFGNIVVNNCNVDSEEVAKHVEKEMKKIGLRNRTHK